MSLTITNEPYTTLTDGFQSKFSYVGNAVYYDIQRKDRSISGVGSYAGRVAFNMGTDAQIFAIGDSVYIYATDGGVLVFEGLYEIYYIDTILGYQWITIDKATFSGYLGIDGGFANNMERTNHRAIVNLRINGTDTTERSFATDSTGLARVYVNSILNDYLANEIDFDYTATNELLEDFAIRFQLGYKEAYTGYEDSLPKYALNDYWAVKSVNQLGGDNRMTLYEVYYNSASVYSTAKFLTAFEKPIMWDGLPFTVCALITDAQGTISKNIKSQPANTTSTVALDLSDGQGVYTLEIDPVASSSEFDLWLSTDEVIPSDLNDVVENGTVDDTFVYTT